MKRLLDELPDGFEATLLRSADRDSAGSSEERSRALDAAMQVVAVAGATSLTAGSAGAAAVGAGTTAGTTAGVKAAATVTLLSKGWVISLAAAGVVAAGAIGTVVLPSVAGRSAEVSSQVVPSMLAIEEPKVTHGPPDLPAPSLESPSDQPSVAPTPVPTITNPRPTRGRPEVRAVVSAPVVVSTSAPPPPIPPNNSDDLAREIGVIDRARAALVGRRPDATLEILDQYDQSFPAGALAREAALLRVEAMSARGDKAAAAQLARALIAKNPDGPYRARLRRILDETAAP